MHGSNITNSLAYAEMRLILARLIYEFDMAPSSDVKDFPKRSKMFTTWWKAPLNVYLTPVKR